MYGDLLLFLINYKKNTLILGTAIFKWLNNRLREVNFNMEEFEAKGTHSWEDISKHAL